MSNIDNHLQQLVENPQESLAVELKRWLDPSSEIGQEKIAKACLALYNNNGGYLLIGIQDDGTPDGENVPENVRTVFHADVVQSIVSRFSYTPFEVTVNYFLRDDQEYPVVSVPNGVAIPAVTKSSLRSIQADEVYVRSLTANNTVSSAKPHRRDWERLIRHCLDNREADIGAFFRRHLGVSADVNALRAAFSLPASLEERVIGLLDDGHDRYVKLNRGSNHPDVGHVEISIIIEGPTDKTFRADQSFLQLLQHHRRDYSGWPPFVCIYNRNERELNPYTSDGAWQANMLAPPLGMGPATLDFWRMWPDGRFYTLRGIQDDMNSSGIEPLRYLDPILHMRRIAEAIAIGINFAEAMEFSLSETQVAFAFRWTKLAGRQLVSWANPARMLSVASTCTDEEAVQTVLVPADTSLSALWQYVEKVSAGLMLCFEGYNGIPSTVIKGIVDETFNH